MIHSFLGILVTISKWNYIRQSTEKFLLLVLLVICFCASLHGQDLERFSYTKSKLGTEFSITFYTTDSLRADSVQRIAFEQVDQLNMVFSDYEYDSHAMKLSRLNSADTTLVIDAHMHRLLSKIQPLSAKTQGAIDVTIGPLTKLWRHAFRQQIFPDSSEILVAQNNVSFQFIEVLFNNRIHIKNENLSLDFGSVAKGFIVDEVFEFFQRAGIESVLIDGGGDIRVGKAPPGKKGWDIMLENEAVLSMENRAIASSGSSHKYLEWNGKKYSHIINPRTGYGITNPKTITVEAATCVNADIFATLAIILEQDEIQKVLDDFEYQTLKIHD